MAYDYLSGRDFWVIRDRAVLDAAIRVIEDTSIPKEIRQMLLFGLNHATLLFRGDELKFAKRNLITARESFGEPATWPFREHYGSFTLWTTPNRASLSPLDDLMGNDSVPCIIRTNIVIAFAAYRKDEVANGKSMRMCDDGSNIFSDSSNRPEITDMRIRTVEVQGRFAPHTHQKPAQVRRKLCSV